MRREDARGDSLLQRDGYGRGRLVEGGNHDAGPVGTPQREQNARSVAGGNRQEIYDEKQQVAECDLRPYSRQKQQREDQNQIHKGPGGGDEDLIAAAAGVAPAVVSTAQAEPELAHRNSKDDGNQHVTHLVEQQASYQQSSHDEASPSAIDSDTKEDAQNKEKPSSIVHAERDHKSVHSYTLAQLYVDARRSVDHLAGYITKDLQKA